MIQALPHPERGPVQVLLLGFEHVHFEGRVRKAVEALLRHDTIRLIDHAFVVRPADGTVMRAYPDREDLAEVGAMVDSLIACDEDWIDEQIARYGADRPEGTWFLGDAIPKDCAALVIVIEHRWATELQAAIVEAGGYHLADKWIHPVDLDAIGFNP